MISRRHFVAGMATASAGSLLLPPTALARALTRAGNFTPIRRGVGTFVARGGTIGYLATPDGLVVIDAQYPDTAAECLVGLQEKSDRRIDVLVNTHHHGDHTAGNPVFAAQADTILAHEEAARLQRASAESRGTTDEQAFPETTYEKTYSLQVGDEILHLEHYGPAHTGGDSVVYLEKADVAHMGDLVFNRMPPFIDIAGGASISNWVHTMETVHARFSDDTVFIHGHGGPNHGIVGTREDLLVMRDFLTGLLEYVSAGIAAGNSADELASVDRLPDFPDHYLDTWAAAIPNAIRAAHTELTAE
jgi:cyclase